MTKQKIRRVLKGTVISNKMNKTLVVRVARDVKHPLYGKIVRRSTKYHVHDELNQCQMGDEVLIEEGRLLSKTKSWRLVERLEAKS